MKPLNLQEFAEQLRLSGDSRQGDFVDEILENLHFAETSEHDELCEDIAYISEKEYKTHDPRRQIDRIGDRLNLLGEIEDILDLHDFKGDVESEVQELAAVHTTIRGLLQDKGVLGSDGDLVEAITQLLEHVPVYDL